MRANMTGCHDPYLRPRLGTGYRPTCPLFGDVAVIIGQ